MMKCWC